MIHSSAVAELLASERDVHIRGNNAWRGIIYRAILGFGLWLSVSLLCVPRIYIIARKLQETSLPPSVYNILLRRVILHVHMHPHCDDAHASLIQLYTYTHIYNRGRRRRVCVCSFRLHSYCTHTHDQPSYTDNSTSGLLLYTSSSWNLAPTRLYYMCANRNEQRHCTFLIKYKSFLFIL